MGRTVQAGKKRIALAALLACLAADGAPAATQSIRGRVLSAGERPIEHARVEIAGTDTGSAFTDRGGRFQLEDVEFPATILVTHPRFAPLTVEVEEVDGVLEVTLEPKQEVYETIAVSANRGEENFAPVSIAASVISPSEGATPVTSVTELVSEAPSVAENGQGGIFQSYSIRGVSRQRVLTLVAGVRLVGERRAGVSASFIDPELLESVEIVRGPSSTYYGSGALGGVVQLFPRSFDRLSVAAGFESQGREKRLMAGGGRPGSSWGVAVRDAGNATTPTGERLDSGFSQLSGSFRRSWVARGLSLDLTVLGSSGREIGKASTDSPARVTTYPEERHLVTRFAVRRPATWDLELAIHPNTLETEVVEKGVERSTVDNEAFDIAASWQRRIRSESEGVLRLGVDYFGRRGVSARERSYDLTGAMPRLTLEQETLADGEEDELGVFGAWERNWRQAVVVVGGRLAWQRQTTEISASSEDDAATFFAGLVVPMGPGFELAVNAGTGLRFPSLSERFFTGSTGRGSVVGNPNLDPEHSLALDVGLRYFGEKLFVAGYLFTNDIDDYIERLEVAPDELTFANLARGRIEGGELDGFVQVDSSWTVFFGGHQIRGRENEGRPLADVPADRLYFGARFDRGRWRWRARWEMRAAKDDAGSGEKKIPAADLVSSSAEYEVRSDLTLGLAVRNLLDESYFNSADRKVPLAPGRSGSVWIRWAAGER